MNEIIEHAFFLKKQDVALRFEKITRDRFQSKERSHDGGSCCQISRLAFCNFSFFQSYFQIVICLCSFLTIPGENSIVVIVAVVNLVHLVNGFFFFIYCGKMVPFKSFWSKLWRMPTAAILKKKIGNLAEKMFLFLQRCGWCDNFEEFVFLGLASGVFSNLEAC